MPPAPMRARRRATRCRRRRPGACVTPPFAAGLAVVLVAVSVLALTPPATATADPPIGASLDPHVPGWAPDLRVPVRYRAPADGRILRGFDPPTTAFGAGHRGVDLDLAVGGAVRAAGRGVVRFAGPVAGTTWVSIAHSDGHLTTYGPLAALRVSRGSTVVAGQPIGVLAAGGHGAGGRDTGLHWGARDSSGSYIDPLSLLGWDDRRPSLIGEGRWRGSEVRVRGYEPWEGGRAAGALVAGSPPATDPGFSVPPNPNHVILLPGLATSSATAVLDAGNLGYDPASVTAFSYAGRDPAADGRMDDPRRDQLPYGPEHTWQGPVPAAALLAEQLRAQASREPGRAVDLVGHSMGGLVILHYLLEHHDPYDLSLPPIGHVITIGSPLRGSDLAVVGESVGSDRLLGPFADGFQRSAGPAGQRLPLQAPAIGQLASGSDETLALAAAWDQAIAAGAAGPLATGTRVLTIGGSRDLVVTPHRTRHPATHDTSQGLGGTVQELPGTVSATDGPVIDHRVLPGGHSSVLETEAVHEVAWRFLSGEEIVTSPGHAATIVGGEVGNLSATAARILHLWGLWRAPGIRTPSATALP